MVTAWDRSGRNEGGALYRFYLKSMPGDQESMLQEAVNKDGEVEKCSIYKPWFNRFIPFTTASTRPGGRPGRESG